jgi:exodeoxyribonuclease VII large subunit
VDALIVCRGGGSLEDLWAFNDEQVVRAIATCPLPVVCGVGHETDTTLAELAADLRAPTPTAAAELATPLRTDELARLQALQDRLLRAAHRRVDTQAQRLDRLALQMGRPARLLSRETARLASLNQRRGAALALGLDRARHRLALAAPRLMQAVHADGERRDQALSRLAVRLAAADPHQVLARGYAWLTDGTGRPVTQAAGLRAGAELAAQWADGRARVTVLDVAIGAADSAPQTATIAAKPAPRKRGKKAVPTPQDPVPDLLSGLPEAADPGQA